MRFPKIKCEHRGYVIVDLKASCIYCGEKGLFCRMIDEHYAGKIQDYFKDMFEGYAPGMHRRHPEMFGIDRGELK